jgi:hypothetical protein
MKRIQNNQLTALFSLQGHYLSHSHINYESAHLDFIRTDRSGPLQSAL